MHRFLPTTLAAALLALSFPQAADAQQERRGKRAGDFVIGFGAVAVLPQSGGRVDTIGGRPTIGDAGAPALDLTWFATQRLALNVTGAAVRLPVAVEGSLLGDLKLGNVQTWSPTLLLQVHPLPHAAISPYFGAGPSMTFFPDRGGSVTPPASRVRFETTPGFVLNAGVDLELAPNWLVNLDVRRIFIRTTIEVDPGPVRARATVDPWVIGASLRVRF